MRDEMVKLEKVKKSCKISGTISKIIACLLTVGFVASVAGIIILGAIGYDKINTEIGKAVESGDATFEVDDVNINGMVQFDAQIEEMADQGEYAEVITVACVIVAVVTAALAVVFWMLVSIFKMITESNTPFTINIRNRIKAIFIMVAVIALITNGLGMGVIVGCIGWSLYSIFDYGFAIQQEVDETL